MESIIVTGGAGFIGSHLCEALLRKGNKVICIDNFNDYYDPKIKEDNVKNMKDDPSFKLYKTDILNQEELEQIFEKENLDMIVHLAACAGVPQSLKNPILYEEVNIKGTLILLELAKKYKIKRFVFASSSSVYGANKKFPFSEDDNTDTQISPYGLTKKSGELLCKYYNQLYKIPIVCLRFFTVYGPRGRPDMAVYKFTKLISEGKPITVFGDGNSQRDYTYISDVIDGIISALEKYIDFEIINLGDNNTIKLKYLIELIEKELNKKAEIRRESEQLGDMHATFADIGKAKKLLGYEPKVKIEQGIKLFVEWFVSS